MKNKKNQTEPGLIAGSLIKTIHNGEVIVAAVTETDPLKAIPVSGPEFAVDKKNCDEYVL